MSEPLRIALIGLVHDHVHWMVLARKDLKDINIVGIVEANKELVDKYAKHYDLPAELFFDSIEVMLDKVKPEAVAAFNKISEHIDVVEACAPRGVHVMVEKPLATNFSDAQKMVSLARKHDIQLLTNYETTWYASIAEAYRLIHQENRIGPIRRIVINAGHRGPIEIACRPEFIEWLTDPEFNGAGALTDFGCYGVNLATWFLKGAEPENVACVTQQFKPELYPKVEDDATIVLSYPQTRVVIQASWHWSLNRKDIAIYGDKGHIICTNKSNMLVMEYGKGGTRQLVPPALTPERTDPFRYFKKLVRENDKIKPFSPSSLSNNLLVHKILDVAKAAAKK